MKSIKKIIIAAFFTACFAAYFSFSASAYIDPATTTQIIQIFAALAITIGVTFGVFRRKIVVYFKNLSVKRMEKKIKSESEKK